MISFTPRPLYSQAKSPRYPLDRRLSGPQIRSGSGGEEKNSQPLPGLESLIIQPVAQRYTTELKYFLDNVLYEIRTVIYTVLSGFQEWLSVINEHQSQSGMQNCKERFYVCTLTQILPLRTCDV
jgi:hypothetical protein